VTQGGRPPLARPGHRPQPVHGAAGRVQVQEEAGAGRVHGGTRRRQGGQTGQRWPGSGGVLCECVLFGLQ